jgi:signal transduction histidine kinase
MDAFAADLPQLRAGINNLASLMALPALWRDQDAPTVVTILLDSLVSMLRLDVAYVRLGEPAHEAVSEVVRGIHRPGQVLPPAAVVGQALAAWLALGTPLPIPPPRVPNPVGAGSDVTLARVGLGLPEPVGVVLAGSARADFPTPLETLLLQVAANQATLALQGARLRQEREQAAAALREQLDIVETVSRTGQLLAAELDLQQLVQAVTDAATNLSGAQFGAFFFNLTDERGESYTLYTLAGAPREAFAQFPLPRNTAVFGPTFRGEGVIRLDDVRTDRRYGHNAPYAGMPPGHLPVASYLAVPVAARSGAVLGGLFLGHPRPGVFTERAERLVVGLAAQTAIALDNARLYQAERQARQAAESANHAKDEFLSVLSHELRTPLTPILGFTAMLRRQGVSTVPADMLAYAVDVIDRSARVQVRLVEDLLDISRIVSGKMTLTMAPTELAPVVAAAVAAVQPAADEQGVTLTTDLSPAIGPVTADADRLQQVVWNLVANAIKFTPAGGHVTVRLHASATEAVLTVTDTGAGIAPDFLPQVFERFRQADASSMRAHGGLGLGLAIVQHLVERHGGAVTAASPGEGQGATFTVRLPLTAPRGVGTPSASVGGARSGATAEGAGRASPTNEPAPAGRLAGVQVLVVEDDADTRGLLTAALAEEGAAVTAVAVSAEARQTYARVRPDVLLTDIGLPGEDGYALLAHLQAAATVEEPLPPAIALTAYASTDDRRCALAAGFQRHLVKPIDLGTLIETVAEVTRS